jgi:hypothetical protein
MISDNFARIRNVLEARFRASWLSKLPNWSPFSTPARRPHNFLVETDFSVHERRKGTGSDRVGVTHSGPRGAGKTEILMAGPGRHKAIWSGQISARRWEDHDILR